MRTSHALFRPGKRPGRGPGRFISRHSTDVTATPQTYQTTGPTGAITLAGLDVNLYHNYLAGAQPGTLTLAGLPGAPKTARALTATAGNPTTGRNRSPQPLSNPDHPQPGTSPNR
jgi:hypothetical protein